MKNKKIQYKIDYDLIHEILSIDFENCPLEDYPDIQKTCNINPNIKALEILNYKGQSFLLDSTLQIIFRNCSIDLIDIPSTKIILIHNSKVKKIRCQNSLYVHQSDISSVFLSEKRNNQYFNNEITFISSKIEKAIVKGFFFRFKIQNTVIHQCILKKAQFESLIILGCEKINYDTFNVLNTFSIRKSYLKTLKLKQLTTLNNFLIENCNIEQPCNIPDTKRLTIEGNTPYLSFKNLSFLEDLLIVNSNISNDFPLGNLFNVEIKNSPNLKPNLFISCDNLTISQEYLPNYFNGTIKNLICNYENKEFQHLVIQNVNTFKGIKINASSVEIKNNIETSFEDSKITKLICENLNSINNTNIKNLISSKKRNLELCLSCDKFKNLKSFFSIKPLIKASQKPIPELNSYEKVNICKNCNLTFEHIILI